MKSLVASSDTSTPHHGAACFPRWNGGFLIPTFGAFAPSLFSSAALCVTDTAAAHRFWVHRHRSSEIRAWRDRPGHSTAVTRCTTQASTGTAGSPPCSDTPSAAAFDGRQTTTTWGCGERRLHERARVVDGGIWSMSSKLLRGSRSAPSVSETEPRSGDPIPFDPHFHDQSQAKIFFLSRVPTWCLHPTPTAIRGGDQSTTWSAYFEAKVSSLSGSTSPPRTANVGSVPHSLVAARAGFGMGPDCFFGCGSPPGARRWSTTANLPRWPDPDFQALLLQCFPSGHPRFFVSHPR